MNNILERFLKFDNYGSQAAIFKLKGDDKLRTVPGACLSVLINCYLVFLTGYLLNVMIQTTIRLLSFTLLCSQKRSWRRLS